MAHTSDFSFLGLSAEADLLLIAQQCFQYHVDISKDNFSSIHGKKSKNIKPQTCTKMMKNRIFQDSEFTYLELFIKFSLDSPSSI